MVMSTPKVMVAECPECESKIRFHRPVRLGQLVICPECKEDLGVRQVNPLELEWAFREDDDDFDFDEDYGEWN